MYKNETRYALINGVVLNGTRDMTPPAHQAAGGDELHQFPGVGGLLFRLTGGRQVDVHVDEPRQHIPSRQIHRL